jgi:hypothetical protein
VGGKQSSRFIVYGYIFRSGSGLGKGFDGDIAGGLRLGTSSYSIYRARIPVNTRKKRGVCPFESSASLVQPNRDWPDRSRADDNEIPFVVVVDVGGLKRETTHTLRDVCRQMYFRTPRREMDTDLIQETDLPDRYSFGLMIVVQILAELSAITNVSVTCGIRGDQRIRGEEKHERDQNGGCHNFVTAQLEHGQQRELRSRGDVPRYDSAVNA